MKNTKELSIRLYIGTLYSNFIVPLRGSNYIQLLYGNLKQRSVSLLGQIRWLVWQGHINGVGRKLGKSWAAFKVNLTGQNLDRSWTGTLLQLFSNVSPKIGSIRVKSDQKIGVNRCKSVRILTSPGTKMRVNECKWVQKIGTNRDGK